MVIKWWCGGVRWPLSGGWCGGVTRWPHGHVLASLDMSGWPEASLLLKTIASTSRPPVAREHEWGEEGFSISLTLCS